MLRVVTAARALPAVLLLVATPACGGDDTPSPAPTTATPTSEAVQPLTGLPAPDGVPDRPALVVKVDNTGNAAPQTGLGAADLVVEEPVEGGLTRFAAFYHSALPEQVAPVRSVRGSDIGIVGPTGGALLASGGAPDVVDQLAAAGLTLVTPGDAEGFSLEPDRRRPYDVAVDPTEVLESSAALEELEPPPPYLPWAVDERPTPGGNVTAVDVTFSGGTRAIWTTGADGTWTRTDDLAPEDDRFAPTMLLVLRVTTVDAGYVDLAGNPVPQVVLAGSGDALLAHGAGVVEARWSRDADPTSRLELTDPEGEPVPVPPGHTWIGLVPEAGSVQIS
ncbi:MAG TPA: DUF3048 domain-containing protein [Jiangellales bacterium]|nr:DUF3048 domain-containing protein [Jiangellales bacterium]